jgi:hypothetical protein
MKSKPGSSVSVSHSDGLVLQENLKAADWISKCGIVYTRIMIAGTFHNLDVLDASCRFSGKKMKFIEIVQG